MKRATLATCALGALVVLTDLGRSDETKDLTAIIDRALEAHGGAAKLAKCNAHVLKGTGKFFALGDPLDYTLDIVSQADKQFRLGVDLSIMGQNLKIIVVIQGEKGWDKLNDGVMEMAADELAEHKEQMYCDQVSSLLPLKDKGYKLAPLGDVKVGSAVAVGVRVSKNGHRDVNLFFDKAKGHLVKSEHMIKDIKAGGKEMNEATHHLDYKEFQGVRHPTRLLVERDGEKFSDTRLTEVRFEGKVDDSTFDRP